VKEYLLRQRIRDAGMNIGEFCEAAGFVRATFDRKITGKNEFDREEICRIRDTLQLSDEDIRDIFFDKEVA